MKKYLPLLLFILGIGVIIGVVVLVKGRSGVEPPADDTSKLRDIPLNLRPIASLTPSEDGYWLALKIEKIMIEDADSVDYELLYKLPDGRTQGVPGTVYLEKGTIIERDLLLGSESSGVFRYDQGVEIGTFTLRFRDAAGKLIAKFMTDWHLQEVSAEISSASGDFKYLPSTTSGYDYFLVMDTFGLPGEPDGSVQIGPVGVFTSSSSQVAGSVDLPGPVMQYKGDNWKSLEGGKASDVGIFISTSN